LFPSNELREELFVPAKPNDCFINIYKSDNYLLFFFLAVWLYITGRPILPFLAAHLTFCWAGRGIQSLTIFFFYLLACTLEVFVKQFHSKVFKVGFLRLPQETKSLCRDLYFCRRENLFSKFTYQQRKYHPDWNNIFCLS
jgi:hypothetical protein